METKQTAIEWLEDNFNFEAYYEEEFISNNKIWQQAKAMEKEQIKETFDNGVYVGTYAVDKDGEEYYYETYNKQDK